VSEAASRTESLVEKRLKRHEFMKRCTGLLPKGGTFYPIFLAEVTLTHDFQIIVTKDSHSFVILIESEHFVCSSHHIKALLLGKPQESFFYL